jgi:hypothetical protein
MFYCRYLFISIKIKFKIASRACGSFYTNINNFNCSIFLGSNTLRANIQVGPSQFSIKKNFHVQITKKGGKDKISFDKIKQKNFSHIQSSIKFLVTLC